MDDLIAATAREIITALRRGELRTAELLDALEARIDAVDGAVNALPTRCFEQARAAAPADGPLAGLPVAIKDLSATQGVRTTFGSPIFADFVPAASDHIVERIESRGGVVYAKSNTPEFGAGANTFNPVFGRTLNPHDLSKSAAGSSGGAAVALRTGTAWLAHGSDLAGSLRTPASFNGVVGLRPTPGCVPGGPLADPFQTLATEGPMARNVADCALFLDAMAGADPREPLSLDAPESSFLAAAEAARPPKRVAWSGDLGITPVDPEIAAICEAAARRFADAGAAVEGCHPDFSGAHAAFQTLRALNFATGLGPLLADHRSQMKPDVIWNIEKGLDLSGAVVAEALRTRGDIAARARAFFDAFDLLLCPTSIVPPYPVEQTYVTRCGDVEFDTYVDWLAIAYAPTMAGLPALSLPCGFTASGMPVGLQIIGPPRGEAAVLAGAAALERVLGLDLRPIDPVS